MQKKCHFRTLFLLVIPNRDRDLEKLSQILISYTPKIRKESLKYHFLYTAFFFHINLHEFITKLVKLELRANSSVWNKVDYDWI